MNSKDITKMGCGVFGTLLSAMGINNTQDIESITSIVCTILGFLITLTSCVIIPVAKKIIKAKADGKITNKEATDILDTLDKGIKEVTPPKSKKEGKNDGKR